MKHGRKIVKLQRKQDHRDALLMNLTCSLIEHRRIRTTLAKAKVARRDAEKMVTLARKGTLASRRLAAARLHSPEAVVGLFDRVVPAMAGRPGGYTRIIKDNRRRGDGAEMAVFEWVAAVVPAGITEDAVKDAANKPDAPVPEDKKAKKAKAVAPKAG